MVDIFIILRHVAHKPIRTDQSLEKTLDQVGPLFKYAYGRGNDSFGPSLRILIRGRDEDVAAFLLEVLRIPGRHRRTLDSTTPDCLFMKPSGDPYPHPLHVALQIQPRLFQLNLDRPMADAIEVADADPLAVQIRQRLDMRRSHPD